MENLQGKCVLLGITGGIAAYKMANVASGLRKAGATVHVIMTENATKFITPLTFETLTNNRCVVDTFARDFQYDVKHISLAKAADLILIAPATANVIAKLANGLADDMLTTTVLAARCKKLVAPAMNTAMLENPITQDRSRKPCWTASPWSWPGKRIWQGFMSPSPQVLPRRLWTRSDTSPITPPAAWAMPLPGRPCCGVRM